MEVDLDRDVVKVGGRRVRPVPDVWMLLHKPVGTVVTRSDPDRRPTIYGLVPDIPGLVYVGRLDYMTSGALLLTTDGTAAHRLTHPRFEVERAYRVLVHGREVSEIRRRLAGTTVIDGRPVRIVRHRLREGRGGTAELLLTLAEGRNRIVRRLCEQWGLKVDRLSRLSYGPIRLGRLPVGKWRYLSRSERERLLASVGTSNG
jgi:23S rRNA pseudouridine2605 synthase